MHSITRFFSNPALYLLLLAAASRLIPHPPNFTAIGAMALFAGAQFRYPALIAVGALLLSDLFLGFHSTMPFVYGAFLLIVFLGNKLRNHSGSAIWAGAAISSSLIFFIISNFGVWLVSGYYEKSAAGLTSCFIAALPFYTPTVLGDLLFTGALFGSLRLAKQLLSSTFKKQTL